jgi:hypothetical protein
MEAVAMSQRVSNKTGTRTLDKTLCVGGIVVSIAAFKAVEPNSILGRCSFVLQTVFRIRIHMFLSLPDPDPLVRGSVADP